MNNQKDQGKKQIGEYVFEFSQEIGCGYSSKVYKGQHLKTQKVVAIKVISSQTYTSPIQKSLLKNEIAILLRIDHPHLLRVYEISESANNTYIISEYCNGGNLEDLKQKTKLSTEKTLQILQQISQGVKALHTKKIIHRDIKPANVLIKDDVYKLADFGFALIQDQFESIIKRFNVGTPMYMAPEINSKNLYTESSDIWALGIVLYELLFQCTPPYKSDIQTFHNDILKKSQKLDFIYQSKVKQLLFGMIQINHEDRIDINQVLDILKMEQNENQEQYSPRIDNLVKLPVSFVSSNLNSPLSTPKQPSVESQRLKYHRQYQSHNKATTFDQSKMEKLNLFAKTDTKVNSISDFSDEESLKKQILTQFLTKITKINTKTDNFDPITQISTECSFSTQNKKSIKNQSNQTLPAIISPTYCFCKFLEKVIRQMNCENDQKLKCHFLFRKLLAIKAKAFLSFAPKNIKDQLTKWIEQLNNYYSDTQHMLNFTLDNTFSIFFNNQLEDQGKLLSMYLVSLLNQIIKKEQNDDFQILIDILQENIKHQNDPFLFARKWAHQQQQ